MDLDSAPFGVDAPTVSSSQSLAAADQSDSQAGQNSGLSFADTPDEQSDQLTGGDEAGSSSTGQAQTAIAVAITTPFSRHLGRNRACASCRERKLKCDGAKPICGQCSRAWATRRKSLKGKGLSDEEMRDMEKPCVYLALPERGDKARGQSSRKRAKSSSAEEKPQTPLHEAERDRRRLERELAALKARYGLPAGDGGQGGSENFQPNSDELSIAEVLATTMRSGDGFPSSLGSEDRATSISEALAGTGSLSLFVEGLAQRTNVTADANASQTSAGDFTPHSTGHTNVLHHVDGQVDGSTGPIDPLLLNEHSIHTTDTHRPQTSGSNNVQPDPLMELVLTGWPSDFPPPVMVDALVRIFFDGCVHLRFLFYSARFFDRLAQGPTSPSYPHPAVLHAMFSLAYTLRPDLDPTPPRQQPGNQQAEDILDAHIRQQYSQAQSFADPALRAGQKQGITMALQSRFDRDRAKLGSAGFHSERAQYHITSGMWEGGDLMSIAKAAFMLTTKRYGCGEIFDAWMSASISTRLAVALGINRSNPTASTEAQLAGKVPVDTIRLAMAGAPSDWVEEEERRRLMFLILATDRSAAASTMWASSIDDADVTVELPMLSNIDFNEGNSAPLTSAPRQTLQSPDLFTKHHIDGFNTMIKGCVLMGRIASFLSRLPAFATEDDVLVPAFHKLDNTLSTFSMSLPFRATDPDESGQIDVFRFATYAVIHTDTLLLHGPLLLLNSQSAAMCETACQAVMFLLRILIAAGVEFARLPPLLIICLGTTGKVLVRRLQILREQTAQTEDRTLPSLTTSSARSDQPTERFDMSMQPAGPFSWSFMPVPKEGGGAAAAAAGMGSAAMSEKEEALRSEIDLVFTYLCKMGQTWPMATRQAQGLAQMLGIDTAAPEVLRQGLFTERNHSGHSYHA